MHMKNFYEVLQVRPNATQAQIKHAYLDLITKYHPDIFKGDKVYAERYTAILTEAYAVLKDEEKRAEYDSSHGFTKGYHFKNYDKPEKKRRREINPQKETSIYFRNTEKKKSSGIFARMIRSKLFIAAMVVLVIEIGIGIWLYLK